ncbi:HEAT repeat domain-containing protein [Microvirga sp. W0021]|uniref:HEAT repeat domain-containing protein n=1 Tax=Hohaiivirga grylli TaxID=3133970 RepID=A0ABV0BIY9_9HYPH
MAYYSYPSPKSLTLTALQSRNSDESWQAIHALRQQCVPETIQLAEKLCRSRNWRKRELGVNVISQLGFWQGKSFVPYGIDEAHHLLTKHLDDPHPLVIAAAIVGLGHRPFPDVLERIAAYATHQDANIRYAVAFALGYYEAPLAVDTVIMLTQDRDNQVRDWATFTLGSLVPQDTPDITDALWQNVRDADEDVSAEAIAGLAERQDKRIIPFLKDVLAHTDQCQACYLEAAEKMGDKSLLPLLLALKDKTQSDADKGYWHNLLDDVIASLQAH